MGFGIGGTGISAHYNNFWNITHSIPHTWGINLKNIKQKKFRYENIKSEPVFLFHTLILEIHAQYFLNTNSAVMTILVRTAMYPERVFPKNRFLQLYLNILHVGRFSQWPIKKLY